MMEQQVQAGGMGTNTDTEIGMDMGLTVDLEMVSDGPLKPLSLAAMEILLAALDPRLEGFGQGPSLSG